MSPATAERITRDEKRQHHEHAIAIITPTIEGREELLAEAAVSVDQQTVGVTHHIIMDICGSGPAELRNLVLERVESDWVAFLDDDDLLDPDHIETLAGAINDQDADLAFSWYRSQGAPETERVHEWDDYALGVMLSGRNLIPVTVLARRQAILDAGGFNYEDRYEDHQLWLRMLRNGCRFAVVPRETWTYRMLGGNRTWLTT